MRSSWIEQVTNVFFEETKKNPIMLCAHFRTGGNITCIEKEQVDQERVKQVYRDINFSLERIVALW